MSKPLEDALREALEALKQHQPTACPTCGHCPTCGRGVQTAPWIPYQPLPWWEIPTYYPWTITTTTTAPVFE